MELKVVGIEEHEALKDIVADLRTQLTEVQEALTYFLSEPQGWRSVSDCCQYFTARGGKPVDRHTMKKMILGWIADDALVLGKTYLKNGDSFWIAVSFLKGDVPLSHKIKLRKVS